jgi:hypothetical protein
MMTARQIALWRCIPLAAVWGCLPAAAQSKVVEDKAVNVRLSMPKDWESRSRGRDLYVDCAPGKGESGRPACYFTIERRKAPAAQKAIAEGDRTKWKGWASGNGVNAIVSSRDLTIAGFPAYEVIARAGTGRTDPRVRRLFILVPGTGQVFDASFVAMGEGRGEQYDRYHPAVASAIETLAPAK